MKLHNLFETTGLAIGDVVKLKKKVQGFGYGSIKGFSIDSKKQGLGGLSSTPFWGAKVQSMMVTLKKSPYHKSDYGDSVSMPITDLIKLDAQGLADEIAKYKMLHK